MRRTLLGLIVVGATMAAPGVYAAKQQPVLDIPEHGLGLLLETPNAPVGDIYSDRPVLT